MNTLQALVLLLLIVRPALYCVLLLDLMLCDVYVMKVKVVLLMRIFLHEIEYYS